MAVIETFDNRPPAPDVLPPQFDLLCVDPVRQQVLSYSDTIEERYKKTEEGSGAELTAEDLTVQDWRYSGDPGSLATKGAMGYL